MRLQAFFGFLLLGNLGGCVPEFEDNLSTISEPRLLAVRATPAEVEPGEDSVVTLSALVAASEDATFVEPRWSLCLTRKPLTELGPVSPACLDVNGSGVEALGRGFEVDAVVPADACRLFGSTPPEAKPGEPAGRPVDPDTTGGYYQPVTAEFGDTLSLGAIRISCGLTAATSKQIQSFNEEYRPNENPGVAKLELVDDELALEPLEAGQATFPSVPAGARVPLRAAWNECPKKAECGDGICSPFEDRANCLEDCETPRGCTGAEPYVAFDSVRGVLDTRRETVRVAWFASAGTFAQEQTGRDENEVENETDNTWLAPARGTRVTLWLVIRDSRGGVSFQTYGVRVE